ncbi:hypothetical protein B0H63DRAFT_537669 [Podospora didyma]|uniref:Uncharacterized protein n=1 Tax=Podospora didyma TaxID=330526 RepID=A0AAE0U3M5_9PEZI|nr:hypothetical protein B0H63DRAFT_537669 [Podospora didyma]
MAAEVVAIIGTVAGVGKVLLDVSTAINLFAGISKEVRAIKGKVETLERVHKSFQAALESEKINSTGATVSGCYTSTQQLYASVAFASSNTPKLPGAARDFSCIGIRWIRNCADSYKKRGLGRACGGNSVSVCEETPEGKMLKEEKKLCVLEIVPAPGPWGPRLRQADTGKTAQPLVVVRLFSFVAFILMAVFFAVNTYYSFKTSGSSSLGW